MKLKTLIILLFCLHAALALFHLNHTVMWDDEASVVWFGKNLNKYGSVIGYDGTHIFSYRNGQLISNSLEYNNPPLDIFYAAAVMRFFGDSDFILRFAFNLLGMIALGVYLLCLRKITKKNDLWFAYAAVLLCLSVNYLLIESNVRYYSLNFLFAALSLWATLNLTEEDRSPFSKRVMLAVQVLSLYGLFLSHYLAAVCWWGMCGYMLFQSASLRPDLRHKQSVMIAGVHVFLFCLCAQYFIGHQALNRPDMINTDGFVTKYAKLTEWFFLGLHDINLIPLWTSALFLVLLVFKRSFFSEDFKKMSAYVLIFLAAMFVLNPQATSKSDSFDIRYLYIIIPLLYLWVAWLLQWLHRKGKPGMIGAVALCIIYVNSSLLAAVPSDNLPRLLLPGFVQERLKPFPTAYSEALTYIRQNFKERKRVLTLPGFHNTVFLRYVPEKIEITNTLTPETPLSAKVVDSLGMQCLFIGRCKPDYVFQFGTTETLADYPFKPADFKFCDTLNVYAYAVDITRPELFWHSFGPRGVKDIRREALYIFHD